ncbi:hypothetical protein PPYR_00649 [Photinus pyralis]|uniref:Uncharacterized protein n=1 Tax=Photinus pyralis TaxID=7054 RepID=A0A1Y1KTG5_PHOPY|nr:uncharacterized protein LOC116160250 [Photinus pyralis]XP_031358502.1 uncharacterized protein LOC116182143 [Photinus pyralis]KAB0790414.1 hypothetical protein PPYR_15220 [Photinus pyralis]KAB0803679.1 hypothetical protein PPYR_00649 [Photinus pyralis]
MTVEIFILVTVFAIFIASCCGFLQKIREFYNGQGIPQAANTPHQNEEQGTAGVFPAMFSPPPYIEYLEPPPKYEDLIKENQITVVVPRTNENPVERSQDVPLTYTIAISRQ